MQAINTFFDAVKLVADRLPELERLVIQVALVGFAIYGVRALFRNHPH